MPCKRMLFLQSHSINFSKTQGRISVNRKKAGKEHERIDQLQIRNSKTIADYCHSYLQLENWVEDCWPRPEILN